MPTWGEILDWINTLRQEHGADAYDGALSHYISNLHAETGRDVILYTTDWTQPATSGHNLSITLSDMQGFMEVMSEAERSALDFILHSPGGSPAAAEQIVNYLREQYDDIRVFIPQSARSAATLICCAGDVVVMGDHSSLGPIDPQIEVQTQFGRRLAPAYSILDQFDQAKEEYQQNGEIGAWGPILTQYGPSLLAECEDAIEYSEELAKEWSRQYMLTEEQVSRNLHEELAGYLANRENFRSHHRPISRSQAQDIGLNVEALEDEDTLQDRVLSVYHAASIMMEQTRVSKLITNHSSARYATFAPAENRATTEQTEESDENDQSS